IIRPQSAIAEARPRSPRLFQPLRNADLGPEAAALLENPQDISRLRDLEPRQRVEKRHNAFAGDFVLHQLDIARLPDRLNPLGNPAQAVTFAIAGPFVRDRTVVVESRSPQHAAVGHHAFLDLQDLRGVARAAANVSNAQIARIDEADELWAFVVE